MELSVAVDRLNNMSREDILSEAMELPCEHKTYDADECLIANLLRHWGVERVSVLPMTGAVNNLGEEGYPFAEHVQTLITDFDTGRL